jgi:dTDP-4-dehydrorhamnose reductase
MKKMLILGASGMAGHAVYYYFSRRREFELYNLCFRHKLTDDSIILDVHDIGGMKKTIKEIVPDYIINCIGVLIKGSLDNPENAIYVNAYFPHILSRIVRESGLSARIVHISTDCVFSGKRGYYTDMDIKDATDVYGISKNLGEIIDDMNLTIRTSIIGPELKTNGEGLFQWLFSMRGKGTIDGYEKSLWGGVTTLELAKAIEQFIKHGISGLYQLTNGKKISKYELLRLIVCRFNLEIEVKKTEGVVCDKSIQSSYRKGFSYTVPEYTTMIDDLYQFMLENKTLYSQYLGQI